MPASKPHRPSSASSPLERPVGPAVAAPFRASGVPSVAHAPSRPSRPSLQYAPNERTRDSVAICFVAAALRAAARRGLSHGTLLRQAGLPEDICAHDDGRVDALAYRALWRAIIDALEDEFFGLDTHAMRPGCVAAIARGAVQFPTVGAALAHVCAMFDFVLDTLHITLRQDHRQASLTITARPRAQPERFAYETLLMLLHGLMCWLAGRRIAMTHARFHYEAPVHQQEYHAMFSPRLAFGCANTELVFDAAVLALPVIQTVATLPEFERSAPESVILKYRPPQVVSAILRQRLRALPYGEWPTFARLARVMATTPATLRRRLADEGQSIRKIKAQLRRERATALLSRSAESVTEIAAAAGFAEPGAFHRAFKRWTGEPPQRYRQRIGQATR